MSNSSQPKKARSPLGCARWIIVALAAAVVTFAVIMVIVGVRRGTMVPLTGERLEQATKLWDEHGAADYDIEIQVAGRQAARYQVQVRGGEPQQATRNGEPLSQKRTWWTWSIPGMLETLRSDVRNMERYAAGEKGVPHLSVLVEFDPELGYPRHYVRVESVKMGGNPEVTWNVTEFNIVEPGDHEEK